MIDDKEQCLYWQNQFKKLEKKHNKTVSNLVKCRKKLSEIKNIIEVK